MSIIIIVFSTLAILGILANSDDLKWWQRTIPFLLVISGIIITISGNKLMHDTLK